MSWDPFLMKILLKKEVCRSHKQCIGPTGKHISVEILVGPMHNVRDPLTNNISHDGTLLNNNNNNNKRRKTQTHR